MSKYSLDVPYMPMSLVSELLPLQQMYILSVKHPSEVFHYTRATTRLSGCLLLSVCLLMKMLNGTATSRNMHWQYMQISNGRRGKAEASCRGNTPLSIYSAWNLPCRPVWSAELFVSLTMHAAAGAMTGRC